MDIQKNITKNQRSIYSNKKYYQSFSNSIDGSITMYIFPVKHIVQRTCLFHKGHQIMLWIQWALDLRPLICHTACGGDQICSVLKHTSCQSCCISNDHWQWPNVGFVSLLSLEWRQLKHCTSLVVMETVPNGTRLMCWGRWWNEERDYYESLTASMMFLWSR